MNIMNCMQNRELSWLKFNERVLEEADDCSVPALERLRFISIFSNNLDEFFMVRVGSLYDISLIEPEYRDKKTNMTANEQLERIYSEVNRLYKKRSEIYRKVIKNLRKHKIYSLEFNELTELEKNYSENYYNTNILPVLSAHIVDSRHPFPFIPNKKIFILLMLKHREQEALGLIPVPCELPEIIFLPGSGIRYIRTEKVIYHFADRLFKKYHIIEKNCVCLIRNADIRFDNQNSDTDDDREEMKVLLSKRNKKCAVRMEANYTLSSALTRKLSEKLNITPKQIYITSEDLKMSYIGEIQKRLSPFQLSQLTYLPMISYKTWDTVKNEKLIKQIQKKDLFLFFPYDSMSVFLQLIKEAAYNPKVKSLMITIYRLSKNSKLVDYLCAAAENGKEVIALVELRARFDESNNIDWSEKLESSGCRVIYGIKDYKVHSKICLITYYERKRTRYITQVGTGNYNEKTAELYTDFSLITADFSIGKDTQEFFEKLMTGNVCGKYNSLLVAPSELKVKLINLIENEIKKGPEGVINIKINSLSDIDFIRKFIQASKAGVEINLIVRGICCIKPGVMGLTDNINVISIVGRFLEHSRIYSFGKEENQVVYISSADLMKRNTERRVEVACPIYDKEVKSRINAIFEVLLKDNVNAWLMHDDGSYSKKENNSSPIDSQLFFMNNSFHSNENKTSVISKIHNALFNHLKNGKL